MTKFNISIVIALEGKVDALPMLLSCLEKQSLPAARYEVLLVFYGNTPREAFEMAERCTAGAPVPVKNLSEPSQNEVRAKNLGASNASGDVVLFLDQDLFAGPRLLAAHAEIHEIQDRPVVVMGTIERSRSISKGALTRWFMREELALMDAAMPDHPFYWSSQHCSLRRASFLEIGGFNETYVSGRAADIQLAQALIKSKHVMTAMQEYPAYIWREAQFEDERKRYWREGYDLCKLSQAKKNPGILYHFRLSSSVVRYRVDTLFAPFYIRACQVPQLDTRIHGQSCQHVFYLDRRSGARAALAGRPPDLRDIHAPGESDQ